MPLKNFKPISKASVLDRKKRSAKEAIKAMKELAKRTANGNGERITLLRKLEVEFHYAVRHGDAIKTKQLDEKISALKRELGDNAF